MMGILSSTDTFQYSLYAVVLAAILYAFFKATCNIYFHPLSKFPGSKMAVCSSLYEFYYDVMRRGMFMWEIEKMHERYGMEKG
jgi:hypothetical protein